MLKLKGMTTTRDETTQDDPKKESDLTADRLMSALDAAAVAPPPAAQLCKLHLDIHAKAVVARRRRLLFVETTSSRVFV